MLNAPCVLTPIDSIGKLDLNINWRETELKHIKGNQAIIGLLMYAAFATRPDVPFAVATLCRYNSYSFHSHLTAAKRFNQSLQSTANFRLHFISRSITGSHDQLTGDIELNWAHDSADHKSHGGHVFLISNGAVYCAYGKHDLIALQTLETEYISYIEGSCKAKWLLQLP